VLRRSRFIALLLVLAAAAGLLGACKESRSARVLLISLDGFRWDYRDRFETPTLDAIAEAGVSAVKLQPAFPSKTFPNHFTLVTGLVPDHHGIVSNTFREPGNPVTFTMSNRDAVKDPAWWQAEPIWTTLEKHGRKTAPLLWPGAEAPIGGRMPTYWVTYEQGLTDDERIALLEGVYSKPESEWPDFATLYWHSVDDAGHQFGPESKEVQVAVERVDAALAKLRARLDALGVLRTLDVIVVADHGMSQLSPDRVIYLEDYIDLDAVETVDSSPNIGLAPLTMPVDEIYRRLAGKHPHLNVWRKHEIPARLQYGTNPRIAPIFISADDGWTIFTRRREGASWSRFGTHGYDNALDSMQALFVAAGPSLKQGVRVERLRSVDVYELMCAILGVTPRTNDGSRQAARALLR
jgi:predicted AlkP superfamily pyrophosphatase or phosphodiesterase